jgi:hypothetical protein
MESNEEEILGLEEAFQRRLKSLGARGNRKRHAMSAIILQLALVVLVTALLLEHFPLTLHRIRRRRDSLRILAA